MLSFYSGIFKKEKSKLCYLIKLTLMLITRASISHSLIEQFNPEFENKLKWVIIIVFLRSSDLKKTVMLRSPRTGQKTLLGAANWREFWDFGIQSQRINPYSCNVTSSGGSWAPTRRRASRPSTTSPGSTLKRCRPWWRWIRKRWISSTNSLRIEQVRGH